MKYKTLTFSDDLEEYEAVVVGRIEIIEEIEGLLNIKFKFSCKEVKDDNTL